jgi:hypothetical protein
MAILVLVLWLFTVGAGFYLLVTSNLGRSRAVPSVAATAAAETHITAAAPAVSAATPAATRATVSVTATSAAESVPPPAVSRRELRRAGRDRFDPPSLTAAKSAPMVPGLRPLLEFAHPAFAVIGLGFWLGFTLVHQRVLGWIAFGLVTATVCLGLTWFAASARAARRRDQGESAPSFGIRFVVLHGGAAAVTFVLAAVTALVLGR